MGWEGSDGASVACRPLRHPATGVQAAPRSARSAWWFKSGRRLCSLRQCIYTTCLLWYTSKALQGPQLWPGLQSLSPPCLPASRPGPQSSSALKSTSGTNHSTMADVEAGKPELTRGVSMTGKQAQFG